MDIQSIKNIIYPSVVDIISKVKEENSDIKITMLRSIFNGAINESLNISNASKDLEVKALFSGRNRAWAKTKVSDDNIVWFNIKNALNEEILNSDLNSENFKECSNLLDVFTSSGLAWMRFGTVSKNKIRFHLRTKGSKHDHHIKVYINTVDLFNGNITNLEGVPHKLGLESGEFKELTKKDIVNIPVSKEELDSFGIQPLEDII